VREGLGDLNVWPAATGEKGWRKKGEGIEPEGRRYFFAAFFVVFFAAFFVVFFVDFLAVFFAAFLVTMSAVTPVLLG
jgi:hypothetical protein